MTIKKPLIGITPWYDYEKNSTYIKNGYMQAVQQSGGIPMLLPVSTDDSSLYQLIEAIDGLLLSGGPDIDAVYFNEENMPWSGEISPYRDYMEIFLVKEGILRKKPILGICRGIQIMNVAMGGSLFQDIYRDNKDKRIIKHSQEAPAWYPVHNIEIGNNSLIYKAFGKDKMSVNSYHHQAIKDLADVFTVTSRAKDGIVESIEYIKDSYAVGVQWHPELMWQNDKEHLKLFIQFVDAAREAVV